MAKKRKRIWAAGRSLALMISALALLSASACSVPGQGAYSRSDTVKVTFVDNGQYSVTGEYAAGNTFSVKRGQALTVTVTPNDGLFLSRSDYEGSRIYYEGQSARMVLPSVTHTQRVRLDFVQSSGTIVYNGNGGKFAGEEDISMEPYDLSHHIRHNTDIGEELYREGYTLIGWNTLPDGSGEHIGLGSRVSVAEGGSALLYAEWVPWTDMSQFVCTPSEDGSGMQITKYCGDSDVVCIPPIADGLPVVRIAEGCFTDCAAQTVILPDTELTVSANAFRDCDLKELYLFDNVESISDDSFVDCPDLQALHINAVEAPKWTDYDRHSNLADKYDILIKHADNKKIVVFGGSGAYFSIDTVQMTQELADMGYVVINMAINAHFNAYMQFQMIEPYMSEGDILIHIPETGTAQMMAETVISDVRIWHGLESNFDLVAQIDIRGVDNIFESFNAFNMTRATRKDKTYADYVQEIDELGNWGHIDEQTGQFTTYKPERGTDTPFTYESALDAAYLEGEPVARRREIYDMFTRKGVRVFLSNAALNVNGLAYELYGGGGDEQLKLQQCYDLAEQFDLKNGQVFADYPVLVGIADCLYGGGRFYNSDYHLGSAAAAENTQRLLQALKRYL